MDDATAVEELMALAEELRITVRRAPGGQEPSGGGAWVRLKGREMIFLDATASPAEQLDVLVSALQGRQEVEDRYLPPRLRELLDEAE